MNHHDSFPRSLRELDGHRYGATLSPGKSNRPIKPVLYVVSVVLYCAIAYAIWR